MSDVAGGAAVASGVTFQENVAAWFAVLILAEKDATPPAGLPADTTLDDVVAETTQPVDDLKIRTSANGQIFVQAKTSLALSDRAGSELAAVIDQFVRQYRSGFRPPNTDSRPLDPQLDRLVLAVSQRAPATIRPC